VAMEPAGETGFAGAGFTRDEKGRQVVPEPGFGGEDSLELCSKRTERGAEEEVGIGLRFDFVFSGASSLAGLASARQREREELGVKGLDEVIQGAEFHGLDCAANRALGGHDDDAGGGAETAFAKEVGSKSVGKVDIEQSEVVIGDGEGGTRRSEGIGLGDDGAELGEVEGETPAEDRLILDDEDGTTGKK